MARRSKPSSPPAPRVPTVEEFALLPTRARLDVIVTGVTFSDGAPVQLVLEALSFEQELTIEREAIKAGKKAGIDYCEKTAELETALALIVAPRIDRSQLRVLLNANAALIEQLCEAGEMLRQLPARNTEAALQRLADVPVPEAPGVAPAE